MKKSPGLKSWLKSKLDSALPSLDVASYVRTRIAERRNRKQESKRLKDLSSFSLSRQESAKQDYRQLSPEAKVLFLDRLMHQIVAAGIPLGCFCFSPLVSVAILILSVFTASMLHSESVFVLFPLFIGTMAGIATTGYVIQRLRVKNVRKNFELLLAESYDVSLAPKLMTALFRHDLYVNPKNPLFQLLSKKLEALLPGVSERHIEGWSLLEKTTLLHVTTCVSANEAAGFTERTRMETLRLLEFVGRTRTLQVVRRLAEGELRATPALQQRAQRILPIIIERVNRLENQQTLLRASQRPEDASALLRPAASAEFDLRTHELLRPTENSPEESTVKTQEEFRHRKENRTEAAEVVEEINIIGM